MIILFVICLWFVVKSTDTCCYGKYCPLPIFNQFTANWTYLLNKGVMSNSACCPSGGSATVSHHNDITSSCRCSRSQSCPTVGSNDAVACPYYYGNTRCPDSNFNGYNFNFSNGYIQVNYDMYCMYTPDGDYARAMSQRCPVQTICSTYYFDGGTGTYYFSRLYNGFAAYKQNGLPSMTGDSYIAVIGDWTCNDCTAQWSITIGEPWGARSFMILPHPISYDDVTSIEGIESGVCPTPDTSANPTNANATDAGESTQSSVPIGSAADLTIWAVIGVIVLVFCGVVLAAFLWRKNNKTKQKNVNELQYNRM